LNDLDELIADLRARDPDRLYTALFAKDAVRARLIGLYAFNLEVASTREKVSEPMLGQIRLQWWRDALDEIAACRPRKHPVVLNLSKWIGNSSQAIDIAKTMIDAREADLEEQPFRTLDQLVTYADATSGNLLHLGLLASGVEDEAAVQAARMTGRAYALAGIIRAVPFLGAQGRVMLPAETLARHGLMDARQSIGRDPAKLKAVLAEVMEAAVQALADSRAGGRSPRAARPVMLHRSLAALYLKRLGKAGLDLSDPRLDPGAAARIAALYRAWFLGL